MLLNRSLLLPFLLLLLPLLAQSAPAVERQRIQAVGIPLADHYAGILAFDRYRDAMIHADYRLQILAGPDLVRAYFRSNADADIAFNVSPMVMAMFAERPDFRWVSLIHRDGNALAINRLMNEQARLPRARADRLPDQTVADAIREFKRRTGEPVEIAIPSPLATHATVLYKYLKTHNLRMGLSRHADFDVVARVIKPPDSPLYLKKKAARSEAAAFEQSLPWPEIAELEDYGYLAWYSKDVLEHPNGHVECVIIAKDTTIQNKRAALAEVIGYIHRAGQDIEVARRAGGDALREIAEAIHRHIPAHSVTAILQTLRADLDVINYRHLNVDANAKRSFREIMDLAHEAGFIKRRIDIEALADEQFSSEVTEQ